MRKLLITLFSALLLISFSVSATENKKTDDQDQDKSKVEFGGTANVGGTINSGNSSDRNLAAKFRVFYNSGPWESTANVNGQAAANESNTTSQNYTIAAQTRYLFASNNFAFGRGSYTYDRFSPYDIVIAMSVGYGRRIIDTDKLILDLQAGPGNRNSRKTDSRLYKSEFILHTEADMAYKFEDNVKLTQTVTNDIGKGNTYTESETALITGVMKNLDVETSLLIKHNSSIPADSGNRRKTDTVTMFSVVYKFGDETE